MSANRKLVDQALADAMADRSGCVKYEVDTDQAFLLYATFCCDVERTAHAVNVKPADIIQMAEQGGWNEKLRGIIELKKSGRAGDVERAVNRAINYVQAHRLREFLQRVLQHIFGQPLENIEEWMFAYQYTKGQDEPTKKFSTRPLADLAVALEKTHLLTYMALGDSASERRGRDTAPDADLSSGDLHAKIAAAMSKEVTVSAKVL